MGLFRRSDLARTRVALLAKALFAAVVEEASTQPGCSSTGRADVFYIRKLDRHFFAEHAALRILLAASDVLLDAVHAFDDGLAGGAIHLEHLALLAAIVARDYFNCVTSAYQHSR